MCVCAADVWHLDLFIGTGSGTESNPIKPGSTTPTTNLHTHTGAETTLVALSRLVLCNCVQIHVHQKKPHTCTWKTYSRHIRKKELRKNEIFIQHFLSEQESHSETRSD